MNKCKRCGHSQDKHGKSGCNWSEAKGGGDSGKLRTVEFCHCEGFESGGAELENEFVR